MWKLLRYLAYLLSGSVLVPVGAVLTGGLLGGGQFFLGVVIAIVFIFALYESRRA